MNLSTSFQLKFSINHSHCVFTEITLDFVLTVWANQSKAFVCYFLQNFGPSVIQNPEGNPVDVSAAHRQFYLCSLSSSQQNTTRSDFQTNITASDWQEENIKTRLNSSRGLLTTFWELWSLAVIQNLSGSGGDRPFWSRITNKQQTENPEWHRKD